MKYKPAEVVLCPERPHMRAVKCYDTFGGPDMWNVQFLKPNGTWDNLQWMGVANVESLFCLEWWSMPRFVVKGEKIVKKAKKKV